MGGGGGGGGGIDEKGWVYAEVGRNMLSVGLCRCSTTSSMYTQYYSMLYNRHV